MVAIGLCLSPLSLSLSFFKRQWRERDTHHRRRRARDEVTRGGRGEGGWEDNTTTYYCVPSLSTDHLFNCKTKVCRKKSTISC